MEEQKPEAKEETIKVDSTSTKSTGDVKSKASEEPLNEFVVLDESALNNKDDASKTLDKTAEKKPAVDAKDGSNESNDKDDSSANETEQEVKQNEKEPVVHENEKNGDELILTADEDLEATIPSPKKANPETGSQEAGESKQNVSDTALPNVSNAETADNSKTPADKVAVPNKNQRVIWVSNISKMIKATDLKQHLSKSGKVTTAKIVTDGKRCFGYVLMENANDASECLKTLNNSNFDGKNIVLSFDKPTKSSSASKTESRPDSKKSSDSSRHKREPDSKRGEKRTRSGSKQKTDPSVPASEEVSKIDGSPDPSSKPPEKKARSRSRSRSKYIRERMERDRLKRHLAEEERRSRQNRLRQIEADERQREKEFKLDQERRKLQMEREFFEKQKKEWARINDERRKLDRDRAEIEQQRARLETDMKKERFKRKSPEMMPSVVSKISDPSKKGIKILKRNDYKSSYDSSAPPPPKLGMDFDIGGRKSLERKMGRAGERKMDVIERKFYDEASDRKKHYSRKPEFEENKSYMKRYPSEREDEHRPQWSAPMGYGSGVGPSAPRYQEPISSQQFAGGSSRPAGYYYQPSSSSHEFSRYDQVSSRKY